MDFQDYRYKFLFLSDLKINTELIKAYGCKQGVFLSYLIDQANMIKKIRRHSPEMDHTTVSNDNYIKYLYKPVFDHLGFKKGEQVGLLQELEEYKLLDTHTDDNLTIWVKLDFEKIALKTFEINYGR